MIGPLRFLRDLLQEYRDAQRLLAHRRRIVFYSERDIYFQYFEGVIAELLRRPDVVIDYVTSDPGDPVLRRGTERFRPWLIRHMLIHVFANLNAAVCVMTMSDLHRFQLKRSRHPVHYAYLFHAFVSTHQQYRHGAFDHYDTVFCVGPHHVAELRAAEARYGLPAKTLVECGYERIEKLFRDHREWPARPAQSEPLVLIAPTWGEQCLLESGISELLRELGGRPWRVVLRPHPEFVKRRPQRLREIGREIAQFPNLSIESDLMKESSIHEADVLITDRSGIAFEFAFGIERPVVFIDTPPKIQNPRMDELEIPPIEDRLRSELGVRIPRDGIRGIVPAIERLLTQREEYRGRLQALRQATLFQWLHSSEVAADHLLAQSQRAA